MPGERRRSTVRLRITLVAAAVVAVVLGSTSAALLLVQARALRDALDDSLAHHAADLAGLVEAGRVPSTLAGSGDDRIAQVVDARGRVVAASPNLAGAPPLTPGPVPPGPTTVTGVPVDDGEFRVLSRTVQAEDPVVVTVGVATDDALEPVGALARSLAVGVPAVVAAVALLVWWLVGRTLRPVEAIRAEVASIGGTEHGRRVPEPPGEDEIARLARTMNEMLGRMEAAAARERRFIADASHELRTPLTRMRTELEVEAPAGDGVLRSVLDETVALQGLVDDLLHLARSDGGALRVRRELVDLDGLVMEQAARAKAAERVAVDTSGVGAAQVRGDAALLARAVANLVDNAIRHAASTVMLSVVDDGGLARVEVVDDGPGIPDGERGRVFERFTRLDEARDGASGGTGLGLAITRDIVEHHGGTVSVEDAGAAGGARLVVTLPIAPG